MYVVCSVYSQFACNVRLYFIRMCIFIYEDVYEKMKYMQ